MSKRSYVEAVMAGLDAAKTAGGAEAPLVRLLLSIDRREGAASAMETVELAAELSARGVVGIDLSGEPARLLRLGAVSKLARCCESYRMHLLSSC